MDKLMQVLKSRKFWAAVVALLVAFFGDRAGVSPEQLLLSIVTLVGYILGTAVEDGLKARF